MSESIAGDQFLLNDVFCDFIKKAKYITDLDMGRSWSHDVRIYDISVLATALQFNRSIVNLKLTDQRIEDRGLIAIIDAIKNNPHSKLKFINFASCGITDEGAKYLFDNLESLPTLTEVNLYANSLIDEVNIARIKAALDVRGVNETEETQITDSSGFIDSLPIELVEQEAVPEKEPEKTPDPELAHELLALNGQNSSPASKVNLLNKFGMIRQSAPEPTPQPMPASEQNEPFTSKDSPCLL